MTDPTPPGAGDPATPPPDPLFAPPDAWSPATPHSGASPYAPPTYTPTTYAPAANAPADPYAPPGHTAADPSLGGQIVAGPHRGHALPGYAAPDPYAPHGYNAADPFAPPGHPASDPFAQPGYVAGSPAGLGAYPSSGPYAFGPGGQPAGYPYDYGYGIPYGHPGYAPPRPTDGLAIASLVVSCVSIGGICLWGVACLIGIVGAILGHVARRRIRTTGAGGSGIALAGIIVGWFAGAIGILMVTLLVVLGVNGVFDS